MFNKGVEFIHRAKKFIYTELFKLGDFEFVRADRGAYEFVLKDKSKWGEVIKPFESADAFAIGSSIYWPSKEAMQNARTLKHELSHIEDNKKLGSVLHCLMYAICNYVFEYKDNPFEIKARQAENR